MSSPPVDFNVLVAACQGINVQSHLKRPEGSQSRLLHNLNNQRHSCLHLFCLQRTTVVFIYAVDCENSSSETLYMPQNLNLSFIPNFSSVRDVSGAKSRRPYCLYRARSNQKAIWQRGSSPVLIPLWNSCNLLPSQTRLHNCACRHNHFSTLCQFFLLGS